MNELVSRLGVRPRASSAALALALLLGLTGACQNAPSDPVHVAESFVNALQRRDVKGVLSLIEARAAAQLDAAAEQASDQVGGRRSVEPWEMLQIVDTDPLLQVASAKLIEQTETTAKVELTDSRQNTFTVSLVFEDETWHVRIPSPPR